MQYADQEVYNFLQSVVDEYGDATGSTIRSTDHGPTERTISKYYGSVGQALAEAGIKPEGYVECPDCGGYFIHIGKHISRKECDLPELTPYQWDLIVGVLMGDGCVSYNSAGNPSFSVGMVEKDFVQWLNDELSPISNKICISRHSNRKDIYNFDTTPHEKFTELRSWYDGGEKRYPEDIELNPTKLKMWYVTDGGHSNNYPSISTHNESDRADFILSLFDDLPFGVRWSNYEVHVESDDINTFFTYIGDPVPGFRYKWPEGYK